MISFRLCSDKHLAALQGEPGALETFLLGGDDEPTITHVPTDDLHFGDEWAQLKALPVLRELEVGGRALGEIGRGPARSFNAAEAAKLAVALGPVKQPGEELQQLKTFVGVAAAKKLGFITYFS